MTAKRSRSVTAPTRRQFLGRSAAGLVWAGTAPAVLRAGSANERLRIAGIGVGGKGWTDINGAARFGDVVAICDVDTGKNRRGGYGAAAEKWPQARRYTDWRELLDKEHKNLDAVTVSTPDHMHAPVTMTALNHGLGAYTQKPLTRTIHEARALTEAAAKAKVPTQMGNQHHSGAGYRALVEIVRGGALGKITLAHSWSNRPIWPQGIDRPAGSDPVPQHFDWDLWLGVAGKRPYKQGVYHPFKWRGWYDFGAGALGDMGCHIIDPIVWSLELGAPTSVGYDGPQPHPETFPRQEVLRYRFPGTRYTAGDELEMTWSDGGLRPSADQPHLPKDYKLPTQGVLMVGEEGSLVCSHGGRPELFPRKKFADFEFPRLETRDHYGDWADGFRSGKAPHSSFGYAGPLTEIVLLGVVASRVGAERIDWDSTRMRFTNSDLANRFVRADYRQGWQVPGL